MGRVLNPNTKNYFLPKIHINVKYPTHVQDCYELVYGMEGTNFVLVDGTVYEIEPGDVMLIPYGISHGFPENVNAKMWVGVFSPPFIAAFDHEYGKNNMKLFSKFRLKKGTEDYLKLAIFHENRPKNFAIKAALYAVCAECLDNATIISEKKNSILAMQILELLEDNFLKPFTMKEAADFFHLEYHYFSNVFHEYFGMNFREFLNTLRFREACNLIQGTNKHFAEIAILSGFQSLYMFNSVFKKLSGMTPTEYKKAQSSIF